MTRRIDHTGHGHPATTAARTACRKARSGAVVGDMIQYDGNWGVVLGFTLQGELKTRFSDLITLYVPANQVQALEHCN